MLTGIHMEMLDVLGIGLGYVILIIMFIAIAASSLISAGPFNHNGVDTVKHEEKQRLILILKTKMIYSPRLTNPKRWIEHRCSKHCKNTSLESRFTSRDLDEVVEEARKLANAFQKTANRLREEGKLIKR